MKRRHDQVPHSSSPPTGMHLVSTLVGHSTTGTVGDVDLPTTSNIPVYATHARRSRKSPPRKRVASHQHHTRSGKQIVDISADPSSDREM